MTGPTAAEPPGVPIPEVALGVRDPVGTWPRRDDMRVMLVCSMALDGEATLRRKMSWARCVATTSSYTLAHVYEEA
ncbi:hypothetical protein L917_16239 [Phytophthora nicotianae]|uniref:Uncharacterized protein n=2 Tax=Phytophthora nicotianae TaxID=4792 RepID=W2KF59_PHYNI|nr:hypothetical protein L917_16239 [Phytophthora nicotianae]ETO65723.1 hypothetical protein F444_17013 [Phytophthora nicotianae P1976]